VYFELDTHGNFVLFQGQAGALELAVIVSKSRRDMLKLLIQVFSVAGTPMFLYLFPVNFD
jgi:hypothetical protein